MLVDESLARIHKKEGIVLMSQDVIRLFQEDTVESCWGKTNLHRVDEGRLKQCLNGLFVDSGYTNLSKFHAPRHRLLSEHTTSIFERPFMCNNTFAEWMNCLQRSKQVIHDSHVEVMTSYSSCSKKEHDKMRVQLFKNVHVHRLNDVGSCWSLLGRRKLCL